MRMSSGSNTPKCSARNPCIFGLSATGAWRRVAVGDEAAYAELGHLAIQIRTERSELGHYRVNEHDADPPHPVGLLRALRERPRGCRAAEKADEIASSQGWHGLPRAAGFPHPQPSTEGTA